jgi:hypothetical protein
VLVKKPFQHEHKRKQQQHIHTNPKILAQVSSMAIGARSNGGSGGGGYTGPWDALWRMRRAEGGWRVWFRGNGANVARLPPEVAFKFAAHDQFRAMFAPPDGGPMGVKEKMAAGAATGVCKTLLFYPLDFARTRVTATLTFVDGAAAAGATAHTTVPSAAAAAAARVGSSATTRQLWTAAAAAAASANGSHVLSHSGSSSSSSSSSLGISSSKIAGTRGLAAAAAAGGATVTPGVIATLRNAVAQEGLLAPYRGLMLSLPGIVVYTSVSFTAYDSLKRRLPSDKAARDAWWFPFAKMGAGAAAGAAAQTASYPLDTLRRRMQMAGAAAAAAVSGSSSNSSSGNSSSSDGSAKQPRPSYAALLRSMAASRPGGLLRALYAGWTINAVRVVPGAAVQFVTYDALRVGVTALDPVSGATSPL